MIIETLEEYTCVVDHIRRDHHFKIGKVYKVKLSNGNFHKIYTERDNMNLSSLFLATRFVLTKAFLREQRINEILENE
jgi:hypothetical protein